MSGETWRDPYSVERKLTANITVSGRCTKCGFGQSSSIDVPYTLSFTPDQIANPTNEFIKGNAIGRSITLSTDHLRELHSKRECDGTLSLSNPVTG